MKLTNTCALSALLTNSNAAFSSFGSRSVRKFDPYSSHISSADTPFRSSTQLNYAQTTLPDSSDPYVLLDLDPSAVDLKTIKKAYRKMALKYHPDANIGSNKEEREKSNEEFGKVHAAYAFLTGKSDQMPTAAVKSTVQDIQTKKHSTYKSQAWQYRPSTTTTHDCEDDVFHTVPTGTSTTFHKNTKTKRVRIHKSRYNSYSSHLQSSRTYDELCQKVQNQLEELQQCQKQNHTSKRSWHQDCTYDAAQRQAYMREQQRQVFLENQRRQYHHSQQHMQFHPFQYAHPSW